MPIAGIPATRRRPTPRAASASAPSRGQATTLAKGPRCGSPTRATGRRRSMAVKGGTADLRVVLDDTTFFEGTVTRPDGSPVPNVTVRASNPKFNSNGTEIGRLWTETRTDADGRYRLHRRARHVRHHRPRAGRRRRPGEWPVDRGRPVDRARLPLEGGRRLPREGRRQPHRRAGRGAAAVPLASGGRDRHRGPLRHRRHRPHRRPAPRPDQARRRGPRLRPVVVGGGRQRVEPQDDHRSRSLRPLAAQLRQPRLRPLPPAWSR